MKQCLIYAEQAKINIIKHIFSESKDEILTKKLTKIPGITIAAELKTKNSKQLPKLLKKELLYFLFTNDSNILAQTFYPQVK